MFVKPMPQPLLYGSRQLQDKVHKTQGLEDVKMASGIRDNMRSTATKLFKRQCVTRLVGKTGPGLRVGKQMIEASSLSERKLDALFMAGFPPKAGNHALILANF